jgi:hypothetical protein
MSFVAVAIGGSAVAGIGSALIQSGAASDAANKQSAAADKANSLQEKMYNQNRADNEPWRQAGIGALSDLGNADFKRDFTASDFQKDPGYDFRMQEGQKALERSAAARGGLQSGGTLKALSRYGQDYASGEYQNAYNRFNADRDRRFGRLSSLAGVGQNATAQNSAGATNYANQVGSNNIGAANAQAAAGMASANAWGNTLSGIGKLGMEGVAMNNQANWMDKITSGYKGGINLNMTPSSDFSYNSKYFGNMGK